MNIAVIENDVVVNVMIAESLELASTLTNLEVLDAELLGIGIGYYKENNQWIPPSPSPDWVWIESIQKWVSPADFQAQQNEDIRILSDSQTDEMLKKILPNLPNAFPGSNV
jgi:hypothetical protein